MRFTLPICLIFQATIATGNELCSYEKFDGRFDGSTATSWHGDRAHGHVPSDTPSPCQSLLFLYYIKRSSTASINAVVLASPP